MSKTEQTDGGPAFPCVGVGAWNAGLTILDWFAGMALQGLLASETPDGPVFTSQETASIAYRQAIEMLAARDRITGEGKPAEDKRTAPAAAPRSGTSCSTSDVAPTAAAVAIQSSTGVTGVAATATSSLR